MHQHLLDIQYQVTAVGTVQRTGPNQREIGAQGAQVGDVFDPPEQVLIARIGLVDDRDGAPGTLVDQQVDTVTDETRIIGRRAVAAVIGQKQGTVFDHVGTHRLEVCQHLRQVVVAVLEFDGELADRQTGDIGVEDAEALAQLALNQRNPTQHGTQLFLDLRHGLLQTRLFIIAQGLELLRAEHLVVVQWGQAVAGRGRQQGDPLFGSVFAQCGGYLVFARLELVPDLLCTAAIFITLKGRRQCGQQILHQLLHVAAQFTAATGRQLQRVWPVRLVEVCDIAPVTGRRSFCCTGGQCLLEQMMLADTRRAHHIQVVATAFDAGGKLDRFEDPLLAQRRLLRCQSGGIGKIECIAVAGMDQLVGCQRHQRPRPAMRCTHLIGHRYSGS